MLDVVDVDYRFVAQFDGSGVTADDFNLRLELRPAFCGRGRVFDDHAALE